MKKRIVCIVLILSVLLASCTAEGEHFLKNPTQAPVIHTLDPNWTPMPQPTNGNGVELTGNPYDYINPERLFDVGEWLDVAGMQFRFNGVEFTKALGDMDAEKMSVFQSAHNTNVGKIVDADGNLYGNYSYVIMHVDMKNNTSNATEFAVGNLGLITKTLEQRSGTNEIRYISPEQYQNKHRLYYLLQPGEEVHFTFYSVMDDCRIDNENLYFYINSDLVEFVPDIEGKQYFYDAYVPINLKKSEVDVYADYTDSKDFINPERVYQMGETAQMNGMSFRVNGLTMERQLTGISMEKIRYDDYEKEIVGKDGTFPEDNQFGRVYVRANVTIQNLEETEVEICTGAIFLSYEDVSHGARGVSPSVTTNLDYHDFYLLQPGEAVTFDVYYVEHVRVLDEEALMIHFPMNMVFQEEVKPPLSYENDVFVLVKQDKREETVHGA